ncbi:MAG: hypothetical protein V1804_04420 [Patescibacteria group bacterium]
MKIMKKNNLLVIFIVLAFFAIGFFTYAYHSNAATSYNYTPIEPIPGFEDQSNNFASFIESLYKFGIWTVGIAALLMITIGGFMYMVSAGNTSKMDVAKKVIINAIIGLIIALTAYLILYIINPDLVKINLTLKPLGAGVPSTVTGKPSGAGKCEVLPSSNPCGTQNLNQGCSSFSSNANQMSQICNIESTGGNPIAESGTDRCKDGNAWSIGLFQINMIASASSIGCNGKEIFSVSGSGAQGECLEYKTNSNGLKYCAVRNCSVINQAKYNECKTKLQNPQTNIQVACSLYSASGSGGYKPWINTANRCGIN